MHERQAAIVSLLKSRPGLVVELMTRLVGISVPPNCTPCDADPALVPGEPLMTADVVTLMKDADGVTRLGIVVELPSVIDEVKRCMWKLHGQALEERERAESVVLVITLTRELAAWAKGAREAGSA